MKSHPIIEPGMGSTSFSFGGLECATPSGVGEVCGYCRRAPDRIRPGLLCRGITIFGPSRAVTATTDIHDDTSDHHAAVRDGAGICDRWVTALDGTDCDGCVGYVVGDGPGRAEYC